MVDVAASLMVEDKSVSGRELDLSTVLDTRQFANGLVDVSFVEDSIRFPED